MSDHVAYLSDLFPNLDKSWIEQLVQSFPDATREFLTDQCIQQTQQLQSGQGGEGGEGGEGGQGQELVVSPAAAPALTAVESGSVGSVGPVAVVTEQGKTTTTTTTTTTPVKPFIDNVYQMRIAKRVIIGIFYIYGAIAFINTSGFFIFIHLFACALNLIPLLPTCHNTLFRWNKVYFEGDKINPMSYVCGDGSGNTCCNGPGCAFFWYWIVLYEIVTDIAVIGIFMFAMFANGFNDWVVYFIFGMLLSFTHEMISIVCITDIKEENENNAISYWQLQNWAVVYTYQYKFIQEKNKYEWTSSAFNGDCYKGYPSFQHPIGFIQRCCIFVFGLSYIILGARLF